MRSDTVVMIYVNVNNTTENMGRTSTPDHKDALLRLACGEYGLWLLLRLPDGKYGAFWKQGFDTDQCIAVAEGRYADALAFIDSSREKVEQYMTEPNE